MSNYVLYTDKAGKFECEVNVKGASTKNAITRLIAETKDLSIVFEGEISNGKCIIPVKKMEGIFENKQTGKLKLEVIVDKTYFVPWQSDFVVESSKLVEVKVENLAPQEPIVEVTVDVKPNARSLNDSIRVKDASVKEVSITQKFENPQTELVYHLLKGGINAKNLPGNTSLVEDICNKFFLKNKKLKKQKTEIIKEAMQIIKSEK